MGASGLLQQMSKDRADKRKSGPASGGIGNKRAAKAQAKAAGKSGHRVVQSGSTYKSDKGKGDVLKAGTHEPYAYYQLNPEMLNPRKKQPVQTFEEVVSHGKKLDKRSGKKVSGGALAG